MEKSDMESSISPQKAIFTLSRAVAYDGKENQIGYRYQITIPEEFSKISGGKRETVYESYLQTDSLNTEIHDQKAQDQYNIFIVNFRRKAEYKGFRMDVEGERAASELKSSEPSIA